MCNLQNLQENKHLSTNSTSLSWVSSSPEAIDMDKFYLPRSMNGTKFGSESISCTTEIVRFGCSSGIEQHNSAVAYPSTDITSIKPINLISCKSTEMATSFMFSPTETSMFLNLSPAIHQDVDKPSPNIDFKQQSNGFTVTFPLDMNGNLETEEEVMMAKKNVNSVITGNSQRETSGL